MQVATSAPGQPSPTRREVSCRTEQALWVEEWKDRQNPGPDWHRGTAGPTNPGNSASITISFCYICQEALLKAAGAGATFIFKVLMNEHSPGHQTGKQPVHIPSRRVVSSRWFHLQMMGQLTTFQPVSADPLQTLELLDYAKINAREDMELTFTYIYLAEARNPTAGEKT